MKTEAYFVPHCDYLGCDLGSFQYQCPKCKEHSVDFEIWWKQYDIYCGNPHKFNCNKCNSELTVGWDENEFEYYAKLL